MADLVIRPATQADAEGVFAQLAQFAVSYRPNHTAFQEHFPGLIAADHVDLVVACFGKEVVGYLLAFRLVTLYANGLVTEIQELIVDPGHRNQGIGRKLIEAAVERAWAAGSKEVTVPTRRAGAYYERLGFVETAGYFKRKSAADNRGPSSPSDTSASTAKEAGSNR
jgi:predicted N-acetyltransferase YhbS